MSPRYHVTKLVYVNFDHAFDKVGFATLCLFKEVHYRSATEYNLFCNLNVELPLS